MVWRQILKRYWEWKNPPKILHNGKEKQIANLESEIFFKKGHSWIWYEKSDFTLLIFTWDKEDDVSFRTILNLEIWIIMQDTNILKLNLSVMLFYNTKCGHGKRTWEMPFWLHIESLLILNDW